MNGPRRRGFAPAAQAETQPQMATPPDVAQEDAAPTRRRKRGDVGGMSLKLSAKARPGFMRRWFNDANNRIAEAQDLAYDFVSDQSIQSTGSDTRISRLVGTQANGEPLRAFLMETPLEEYEAGLSDKEAFNRRVDEAITTGSDFTGQMPSSETYGQGSIQRDR
jgi:hypothetical protein